MSPSSESESPPTFAVYVCVCARARVCVCVCVCVCVFVCMYLKAAQHSLMSRDSAALESLAVKFATRRCTSQRARRGSAAVSRAPRGAVTAASQLSHRA